MGLIFSSLILVVTAVLAWWISGYDPKLTGENKGEDILRRIIRCGLTLFFMAGGLAETLSHPDFAGFVAITIAGPMVFLWINCLCEALAHAFQSLIDNPSASSGSDPKMKRFNYAPNYWIREKRAGWQWKQCASASTAKCSTMNPSFLPHRSPQFTTFASAAALKKRNRASRK
jgi:hypothetical protein